MNISRLILTAAAATCGLLPMTAQAQWYLRSHTGIDFVTHPYMLSKHEQLSGNAGFAVGYLNNCGFSFEPELTIHMNRYWHDLSYDGYAPDHIRTTNYMLTSMVNAGFTRPCGWFRPFASLGIGCATSYDVVVYPHQTTKATNEFVSQIMAGVLFKGWREKEELGIQYRVVTPLHGLPHHSIELVVFQRF